MKTMLAGLAVTLVAHDPSKAPLAPSVKFTEQAQVRARSASSFLR